MINSNLEKVLVIDDEPDTVNHIELVLKPDYEIIKTYNGSEGLELAKTEKPSVILLDLEMPEMKGFEVCEALKTSVETQFIPVIMVTSLSSTEDKIRCLELGADEFLTKPLDSRELRARIKALLSLINRPTVTKMNLEKVLVVDDEYDIHALIRLILGPDYEVISAYNGPEGLELAKSEKPSAILLDLEMPEMKGFEVCEALKTSVETQFIPVVMVTSSVSREDKIRCLELGADGYIFKPFNKREVKARVKSFTRIIAETKEMMNSACNEFKGTPSENIVCGFNRKIQKLKIGSQEYMKIQIQALYRNLKSSVPIKAEYTGIHDEIELLLKEKDLVCQYTSLNMLIPKLIQINVSETQKSVIDEKKNSPIYNIGTYVHGNGNTLTETSNYVNSGEMILKIQNDTEIKVLIKELLQNLEETTDLDVYQKDDIAEEVNKIISELAKPVEKQDEGFIKHTLTKMWNVTKDVVSVSGNLASIALALGIKF